jgi:hypothetical protein
MRYKAGMTREPGTNPKNSAALARENRLKAALKANMGRRKAQARARGAEDAGNDLNDTPNGSATAPQETK